MGPQGEQSATWGNKGEQMVTEGNKGNNEEHWDTKIGYIGNQKGST